MIRQLRYYDEGGYTDEEFSAELEGRAHGMKTYPTAEKPYYSKKQPYLHAKLADEERSNRSRISYYEDEDTSVKGGRGRASRFPANHQYP